MPILRVECVVLFVGCRCRSGSYSITTHSADRTWGQQYLHAEQIAEGSGLEVARNLKPDRTWALKHAATSLEPG